MSPQVRVPGYELMQPVGAGAASIIYRARELATGRIVAVKYVSVEGRENWKYLRHIRNEYRVLRALQDSDGLPPEGIVRMYRFMRWGRFRRRKQRALVMEYLDGPDLRRERRYPPGQLVDILLKTARALSALHAKEIIHGDVKPENIIVSPKGRVVMVDFGFSCRVGFRAPSIRGTREYIAPEQVERAQLTERTDIYNFGATMYFLFTGRHVPALLPDPDDGLFIGPRGARPEPPRSLNPDLPAALDKVIMRCLEKDPLGRPSCIEEVMDVLLKVRDQYVA